MDVSRTLFYPVSSVKTILSNQQCKTEMQFISNRRACNCMAFMLLMGLGTAARYQCCNQQLRSQLQYQQSQYDLNTFPRGFQSIQSSQLSIKWLLYLLQACPNCKTVYIKVILLSHLSEESFREKLCIAKLQPTIGWFRRALFPRKGLALTLLINNHLSKDQRTEPDQEQMLFCIIIYISLPDILTCF